MKINFDQREAEIIHIVGEAAELLNVEAYLVGGYVRDKLLDRPSEDMDILVVGDGIALAEKVCEKANDCSGVTIFKRFGTAMLRTRNLEVEFVGARKESYRKDSRKPVVERGTLEDDLLRRDFTVNALAVQVQKVGTGQIVDQFGGLPDLQNKIIRTPVEPAATFSDDPLRMMRAVRFANQLLFTIDENTFQGIKESAHRIEIVSMERISTELQKIMMCEQPSYGLRMMDQCGLLDLILPEFVELKGAETRYGIGHKDNFEHTLEVLDKLSKKSDDVWLRWAALLHDIAKPRTKRFEEGHGWTFHGHEVVGARMVKGIFKRLKLSMSAPMRFVQKMVALHLRPIALTKTESTDSAVRRLLFDAGEDIDSLLLLCEADITSKNPEKVEKFLRNYQIVRQRIKEVEDRDRIRNWQPPVSGKTIMEAFGIKPSKEVGLIKDAIKEAILDGEIPNDPESAIQLMYELGEKLGLGNKK
ncbi:MAG: HD domain-containing protein [Saprospirales bacterium]|nr:MAG: HD domain-containing protein [Saprospirales bacterium]